ncbi:MAG TPA: helix-turn-helix domain-containing protein [Gaiellaceae bacterium]
MSPPRRSRRVGEQWRSARGYVNPSGASGRIGAGFTAVESASSVLGWREAASWSCRCCTCWFGVRLRLRRYGCARASSRSSRSWCFDTSLRFFAARSPVRAWTRETGCSLAAASRLLNGKSQHSFFVRPDTLLGWHRQLVRRRWTYAGRRPGRPSVSEETHELVLRLARENRRWGYQRIVGELAGVGVRVSATTVAKILREAGLPPADARARLCWREFLRAHAESMLACDGSVRFSV